MGLTYILIGAWAAVLSAPAGWILGARVGDSRGLIGYAASALAFAAGTAAAINTIA